MSINDNGNHPVVPFPDKKINVNLDDCENVKCEDCESDEFEIVWILKKISAVLSTTGKPELLTLEYFKCKFCGKRLNIIRRNR